MKPLISIVIPVYNTEQFLSECLDSCIKQTLQEIEIIVVNDASPGNCIDIVKEYQKQDSRIKFVNLESNKGTLLARRSGFEIAEGKYIQSVDADDSLVLNACEVIYKTMEENHADVCHITMHGYYMENPQLNIFVEHNYEMFLPQVFSINGEEWRAKLFQSKIDNCMCSYIITNDKIKQILSIVPNDKHITIYEDFCQIFTLAHADVHKVISLDNILYNYRLGVGIMASQLTSQKYAKRISDTVFVMSHIWELYDYTEDLYPYFYHMYKESIQKIFTLSTHNRMEILSQIKKNDVIHEFSAMMINMISYEKKIDTESNIDSPMFIRYKKLERIIHRFIPPNSLRQRIIKKIIKQIFKKRA